MVVTGCAKAQAVAMSRVVTEILKARNNLEQNIHCPVSIRVLKGKSFQNSGALPADNFNGAVKVVDRRGLSPIAISQACPPLSSSRRPLYRANSTQATGQDITVEFRSLHAVKRLYNSN